MMEDEHTRKARSNAVKAMKGEHTQKARKYLGFLRGGTAWYALFIGFINAWVCIGSFSLADIGTTKKELEELWVEGCKADARELLRRLRSGTEYCAEYRNFLVSCIRKKISEGGFLPADIGTSEKELASFI